MAVFYFNHREINLKNLTGHIFMKAEGKCAIRYFIIISR